MYDLNPRGEAPARGAFNPAEQHLPVWAGAGNEVERTRSRTQRGLIHSMQVVLTCLKGLESKRSLPVLKTWLFLPWVDTATKTRCWVKMAFNQVCDDRFLKTSGCLMKFVFRLLSFVYTVIYREREREADGRRRKREREGGREEFLVISSQRPPECLHPPKSICWIPYPKSNGIWRWGLWEVTGFTWSQGGRAPTMGMLLPHDPFPPREDAASGCKPGRGHSPKTWPCWYPDLRPPALR